jgi:hypothetical protein
VFRSRPAATHASTDSSIAVLPFVNLSSDKEQEYFSDGIAEEILNALAQVDGLRVIGRTSSFSMKGKNEDLRSIGMQLNAANLLEGSVRKAGRARAHHGAAHRGGGRVASLVAAIRSRADRRLGGAGGDRPRRGGGAQA